MDYMLADCIDYILLQKVWNLPVINQEIMLYAAIFHDVNHSGGKFQDHVNINNAQDAWKTYFEKMKADSKLSHKDAKQRDFLLKGVLFLIRCTQYPYLDMKKIDERNIFCKSGYLLPALYNTANVLRDTDLMTIYSNEDFSARQLWLEISNPENNKVLSYKDYVENNTNFLRNIVWHSIYGVLKAEVCDWDANVLSTIQLMDDYVNRDA